MSKIPPAAAGVTLRQGPEAELWRRISRQVPSDTWAAFTAICGVSVAHSGGGRRGGQELPEPGLTTSTVISRTGLEHPCVVYLM